MKGTFEVHHWKKILGIDAQKTITATYKEQGIVRARLWPAGSIKKTETDKQKFLMIYSNDCQIEVGDRIEKNDKKFRAISVKAFPKHCEAVIEEEV